MTVLFTIPDGHTRSTSVRDGMDQDPRAGRPRKMRGRNAGLSHRQSLLFVYGVQPPLEPKVLLVPLVLLHNLAPFLPTVL